MKSLSASSGNALFQSESGSLERLQPRVSIQMVPGVFQKHILTHLSSFNMKKELLQWIKRFSLLIRKP